MDQETTLNETPAEHLLQEAITPYIAESEGLKPDNLAQVVAATFLEMELNS